MKKSTIDYSKYKEISIHDDLTNQGHGNTLSIKVVLPVGCQANCNFCFGTCNNVKYKKSDYFDNLEKSINRIRYYIDTRRLSFDITGGEPTAFNDLTGVFRTITRSRNNSISSENIVLTTNGCEISDFYYSSAGDMVDIVNISMHSFDEDERMRLFGTSNIPNLKRVKHFCNLFSGKGVKCSAVCVITEDRLKDVRDLYKYSFIEFLMELSQGAHDLSFRDLRIRLDYLNPTSKILEEFFDTKFSPLEHTSKQLGLWTKTIEKGNGFDIPIKIFKGVPDLIEAGVIGVELVIDTDGKLYLDYGKKYLVQDHELYRFNQSIYIDRRFLVQEEKKSGLIEIDYSSVS